MVGQGNSIAGTSCRDRTVGDDGRNGGTWRATYLRAPCVLCTLANDPLVGSLADRGSADCGYRYVGPASLIYLIAALTILYRSLGNRAAAGLHDLIRRWAVSYTEHGKYSPVGVWFHWIMAGLVLFQLGSGWMMSLSRRGKHAGHLRIALRAGAALPVPRRLEVWRAAL